MTFSIAIHRFSECVTTFTKENLLPAKPLPFDNTALICVSMSTNYSINIRIQQGRNRDCSFCLLHWRMQFIADSMWFAGSCIDFISTSPFNKYEKMRNTDLDTLCVDFFKKSTGHPKKLRVPQQSVSHAIGVPRTQMVRDLHSHILVADFAETRKC